jgi:hypothetical protein
MPFTDSELANAMQNALLTHGVLDAVQLAILQANPSETQVRQTLRDAQLCCFGSYWNAINDWLLRRGAYLGLGWSDPIPGRLGAPACAATRVLYTEAFGHSPAQNGRRGFAVVLAVAGQLRFVAAHAAPHQAGVTPAGMTRQPPSGLLATCQGMS